MTCESSLCPDVTSRTGAQPGALKKFFYFPLNFVPKYIAWHVGQFYHDHLHFYNSFILQPYRQNKSGGSYYVRFYKGPR